MERITYLGRQIYPRKRDGRFASRRYRLYLYLIILGLSLLAFNIKFGNWYEKEISYVAPAYAGITMEAKVEVLKEDVLNRLMACESAGYSEDDGIVILDSNDKHSFGQFQFQKKTIQHYMDKLYGQKVTGKEAVLLALDTARARSLAEDIIWKEEGGIFNWENCAKKTGIVPDISVIKKLEK